MLHFIKIILLTLLPQKFLSEPKLKSFGSEPPKYFIEYLSIE